MIGKLAHSWLVSLNCFTPQWFDSVDVVKSQIMTLLFISKIRDSMLKRDSFAKVFHVFCEIF